MPLKKNYGAGVQECFWSQIDTRGHMTAWDGTTTTGATAQGMRQFVGMKTANPTPVEPEFPQITGDDGPIGRIDFGSNETPNWIMEVAINDLDTDAILQGTIVHAIGEAYFNAFQPLDAVYPDIAVVYNSKAKNSPSNTKAWSGIIFPVVTAVPLDRDQYQERTPAVFKYKLLANPAAKYPWGVTITEAIAGTTEPVGFKFQSDNPIILHRLTGDGALATFNLPKTPVSVSKTVVWNTTGASLTVSSISTANNTMTLSAIPAINTEIYVMMEYSR